MPQKVIVHKRNPQGSLLKKRISSISSDSINSQPVNLKSSAIDKKPKPEPESSPENKAKSRRRALKDFYRLRDKQQKELSRITDTETAEKKQDADTTIEKKRRPSIGRILDLKPDTFDEYVSQVDFIQLLKKEDEILDQLGNDQSEVKSIVYNNYYELIKINDILMNIKDQNEKKIQSSGGKNVEDDLKTVTNNLESLKKLDQEMMDDYRVKEEEVHTLPSADEVLSVCHGINRLILGKNIDDKQISKIEEILPNLKQESLILQLNEIKERAGN